MYPAGRYFQIGSLGSSTFGFVGFFNYGRSLLPSYFFSLNLGETDPFLLQNKNNFNFFLLRSFWSVLDYKKLWTLGRSSRLSLKETEDASPTPQMLLPLCKLTFRSYRTASNRDFEGLALCVGLSHMKPAHMTCLLCALPFYFCAFEPFSSTNADVDVLEGQGGQKKQTSPREWLPGMETVGSEGWGYSSRIRIVLQGRF